MLPSAPTPGLHPPEPNKSPNLLHWVWGSNGPGGLTASREACPLSPPPHSHCKLCPVFENTLMCQNSSSKRPSRLTGRG